MVLVWGLVRCFGEIVSRLRLVSCLPQTAPLCFEEDGSEDAWARGPNQSDGDSKYTFDEDTPPPNKNAIPLPYGA